MSDVLPSYLDFSETLQEANLEFQPAEIHGLFSGFLTAATGAILPWEKIILKTNKNEPCRKLLKTLYTLTEQQLNEFSFEFMLLLPDDDDDIKLRTEALGLWCQGFLTGLKQANIPIQKHPNPDIAETLQDLTEIAQVDNENIIDTEEDETAYFELVEYVRLAVLMIFQELKPQTPPIRNNDHLH